MSRSDSGTAPDAVPDLSHATPSDVSGKGILATSPVWLAIPSQPQRQDSIAEQLDELRLVAIHLGMYDALDYIQRLGATR
jgi:hypothetical protein